VRGITKKEKKKRKKKKEKKNPNELRSKQGVEICQGYFSDHTGPPKANKVKKKNMEKRPKITGKI